MRQRRNKNRPHGEASTASVVTAGQLVAIEADDTASVAAVGEAISLAELALRILALPPISRGTHFIGPNSGPKQHARRLVELWQVADGEVPLAEAFRLLDVNAVADAVLRGMAELEREGDPRYWTFPTWLEELLPALRELAWQRMLAGNLLVEGIKGIRGKSHRSVLPAELPRLMPDWQLSRLTRGANDEFIDVRVRHAPIKPAKKTWRKKSPKDVVKAATLAIDKQEPEGKKTYNYYCARGISKYPETMPRKRSTIFPIAKVAADTVRGNRGSKSPSILASAISRLQRELFASLSHSATLNDEFALCRQTPRKYSKSAMTCFGGYKRSPITSAGRSPRPNIW